MPKKVTSDRGAEDTLVAQEETNQIFDDAWEQANKDVGDVASRADLSEADDPANVKNEPPLEPPVVPSTSPAADVTPATPAPKAETKPAVESDSSTQQPEESDEKYEQRYKTLQGIHKHDKETWEVERTRLLSDLEEAKKPKSPLPPPPPTPASTVAAETFIDSLTDEQKQQLEEYEQDFDVVSKMEGIKRSLELGKLRKEIEAWKSEITSHLTAQIAPALSLAEENEANTHFNLIREGYDLEDGTHVPGHDDFEKYRDDGSLLAWIESKPRYLQPTLKETYSKGSAVDVVDLYTDFKRENNIPITPTVQSSSGNIVSINAAKATKKAALQSVTNRRGAVNPAMAVATDYDSAWDEANAK